MCKKMKALQGILLGSIVVVSGCGGFGGSQKWRSRSMGDISRPEAFAASRAVMAEFFGISAVEEDRFVVKGRPKLFASSRPTGRVGQQLYPRRQQLRRIAKLRVRRKDKQLWADCRVEIQQLDSSAFRAFRRLNAPDDMAVDTPMQESEAGPLASQAAWTTVKTDRAFEQKMLARLRERIDRERKKKMKPKK